MTQLASCRPGSMMLASSAPSFQLHAEKERCQTLTTEPRRVRNSCARGAGWGMVVGDGGGGAGWGEMHYRLTKLGLT